MKERRGIEVTAALAVSMIVNGCLPADVRSDSIWLLAPGNRSDVPSTVAIKSVRVSNAKVLEGIKIGQTTDEVMKLTGVPTFRISYVDKASYGPSTIQYFYSIPDGTLAKNVVSMPDGPGLYLFFNASTGRLWGIESTIAELQYLDR